MPEKCQIKKGFFYLFSCHNSAIGNCIKCSIPVCSEHSRVFEAGIICRDCYRSYDEDEYLHNDHHIHDDDETLFDDDEVKNFDKAVEPRFDDDFDNDEHVDLFDS